MPAPAAPAVQAKPQQERRGDRNLGKTKPALKWGKDAPHIQQLPLVRPSAPMLSCARRCYLAESAPAVNICR